MEIGYVGCYQNIGWAIVTNKPERFTNPLIERLALKPSNGVAICPDHVTNTKPDPEPLFLAADKLGIAPELCLYAGDHRRHVGRVRGRGMNSQRVTLIPGDLLGRELAQPITEVCARAGAEIEWDRVDRIVDDNEDSVSPGSDCETYKWLGQA